MLRTDNSQALINAMARIEALEAENATLKAALAQWQEHVQAEREKASKLLGGQA